MTLEKNKCRDGVKHCRTAPVPGTRRRLWGGSTPRINLIGAHRPTRTRPRSSSACARRANPARPLVAFPTPEFRALLVLFHGTAPSAQPMRKLPWCSALPEGTVRRRSLQTPAASRDGCCSGDGWLAVAAPCCQGRGTLASAAWCGAAAGLPAAHLCRQGCGPEAAGGSLHFPA